MIFFPLDAIAFAGGTEAARIERARFNALSHEEKLIELRLREVRALEDQASAMRERNSIERNKFF